MPLCDTPVYLKQTRSTEFKHDVYNPDSNQVETITRKREFDHSKSDRDYKIAEVPCGRCPNCIKKRVSAWQFRLEQEQKHSITASFITLTYSDDHLPFTEENIPHATLEKSDLQKFLKRLRKECIKSSIQPVPLKYYACGEYGTTTQRPHYHLILFNVPHPMLRYSGIIERIWGKGHIQIDPCTPASIGYVTGYVMKKNMENQYIHFKKIYNPITKRNETHLTRTWKNENDKRNPEFATMSKHLGEHYLTTSTIKYHHAHNNNYIVSKGGIKVTLPNYYKEKIFNESQKQILKNKTEEYIQSQPDVEERLRLTRIDNRWDLHERNIQRNRDKL